MKTHERQEGGILVVVALVVMVVTVLAVGFLRLHQRNSVEAAYVEHSNQAFWLAEAGIQHVVSKLRNDDNFRPTGSSHYVISTNTAGDGSYVAEYWLESSNYVVQATGVSRGERRRIEATFILANFGPYGITTLEGDSQIRRDGTIIGSVYVNGDLTTRRGTVISGTVLAENYDDFGDGEPIPEDGELDLEIDQSFFSPYLTLLNTGTTIPPDTLDLSNSTVVVSSSIDPASIISTGGAGTLVIRADQTFSKDLNIGPNVTIIVDGDLKISKSATMDTEVTIFATGEADLFKDADIGSTATSLDGCSILCLGDMKVWKNFDFNGTLFTEGYLEANQDLNVTGAVVTQDGFDLKQNANIVFDINMINDEMRENMIHGTDIVINSQWRELSAN